ncbi:flavin monoamine oxidase family protein [Janthinobacterium fluminis]|uniref:Tryptophan 2-monooxygenase n=1 Tax=Janthinobacterium fluminis TaxID=2987524 RepID=A0ABT5JW08_9BURK|nr:FAD-dependent oxidoreductase [Janthinobacterium fluminis]MDC8756920.1 FAD-dependent oxidoreductase [Janthinobacterium fluminis]
MSKTFHDLLDEQHDPVVAEYLAIIKNGLPKTAKPQKIAIVGAGVAGLVSAQLLAEAGHEVTIFEGNTRIGGRILTLRGEQYFGRPELYGEAGAMRLPLQIHHMLRTYICKYAVPVNFFYQVDVKKDSIKPQDQNRVICDDAAPEPPAKAYHAWTYVNGVKMRTGDYLGQEYPAKALGYDLSDLPEQQQRMNGPAMLASITDFVKDYVNAAPRANWPEAIARYDQYSINGFFQQFSLLSENGIEFVEVLQNLESRRSLSFVQNLIEMSLINSDNMYWEISNGSDNLVKAWIAALQAAGVQVCFNEWIDSVAWSASGARATLSFSPFDKHWNGAPGLGAELSSGQFVGSFSADHVILTVPVPCLRTVDFSPLLPQQKRKMIRELYYDSAAKVLLSFDERFWETRDNIWGGGSVTDLANRMIYYPSHGFGEQAGVILASYTWETEARGWGSLNNEQRVQFALDGVAQVHGDYVRKHFISGFSVNWDESPFAMGEAAMFAPGQLSELQEHVAPPVGNLHFAGDWTTLRHAWIEGAIESGIRAALEIEPTAAAKGNSAMFAPIPPIVT